MSSSNSNSSSCRTSTARATGGRIIARVTVSIKVPTAIGGPRHGNLLHLVPGVWRRADCSRLQFRFQWCRGPAVPRHAFQMPHFSQLRGLYEWAPVAVFLSPRYGLSINGGGLGRG